jgi:hypothetical protein
VNKGREPVPISLRRILFVEAGYRCSVSRCTAEASLEIHHVDGDPGNNDAGNLIVLCANHHTQATNGKIDRLACLEIKRQLAEQAPIKVDHKRLANLIAQSLVNAEWPDPIHSDSSLKELAEALDRQIGAKAELIARRGERLVIWIQAASPNISQAKALVLAVGCVASSLAGVKRLEVGFSDTYDFVRTTGGPGVGAFRVCFDAAQVSRVARDKEIPPEFWACCTVLIVSDENTPFMKTLDVSIKDFERPTR